MKRGIIALMMLISIGFVLPAQAYKGQNEKTAQPTLADQVKTKELSISDEIEALRKAQIAMKNGWDATDAKVVNLTKSQEKTDGKLSELTTKIDGVKEAQEKNSETLEGVDEELSEYTGGLRKWIHDTHGKVVNQGKDIDSHGNQILWIWISLGIVVVLFVGIGSWLSRVNSWRWR